MLNGQPPKDTNSREFHYVPKDIAKKYGKTCLVGCFSESKLAISAAAAVVLSRDNIESADLDSFFSFTNPEIGVTGGFKVDKDIITMSDGVGFGFDEYEF